MNKQLVRRLVIFQILLLMISLGEFDTFATAYIAGASGDWNSTATWGGSGPPNSSSDTITIDANITVTVGAGDTESCASIVLDRVTGDTTALTVSGTGNLTVSSTITQSGSAGTADVNVSGGGTLNLSDVGTPIGSSVTLVPDTSVGSTVNYTGAGNQTIAAVAYDNLGFLGSGTESQSSTYTLDGTLTMSGTAISGNTPAYGAGAALVYNGWSGTIGKEWGTGSFPVTLENGSVATGAGQLNGKTGAGNVTVNPGCTLTFGAGSGSYSVNTPGIVYVYGTFILNNGGNNTLEGTGGLDVETGGIVQIGANKNEVDSTVTTTVLSGGTVEINTTGSASQIIPLATWQSGSICDIIADWAPSGADGLAQSFDTLEINPSSGSVTLGGIPTVNNKLELVSGTLATASGKTPAMAGGSSIVVTAGGISGVAPTFSGTVNVTYNGSSPITTGLELPTSSGAVLNNLTISDAAGVTLGGNVTVNGTLAVTAYNGSTVPLVAGSDTVTFESSPVSIMVPGSTLPSGAAYTIVSSSGTTVGGSLGTLTINGAGVPSGATSISDSTGQLVLNVASTGSPTPAPKITSVGVSGTTLLFSATNGTPGGAYILLESTNPALPFPEWTPVFTNIFDANGDADLSTNVVDPAHPQDYFILEQ